MCFFNFDTFTERNYGALKNVIRCRDIEDHDTLCLLQFSSNQGSCSLEVVVGLVGLVALVALVALEA